MKLKTLKKHDTVVIIGRRWFERVNGNTYHSCYVNVNGEALDQNEFEYGYGSQWEYTGLNLLKKHYLVPETVTVPWKLREVCNYVATVSDVQRKKDL